MQRNGRTVIPFDPRRPRRDDLPVPLDHLRRAVHELDDLRYSVEQLDCDPLGSADDWPTALMPIMLRLPGARRALSELRQIKAGQWPDTEWAVRVRAAHADAERRLLDVDRSIRSLIDETDFVSVMADLRFDGPELAHAVHELCALIVRRYPTVANAS